MPQDNNSEEPTSFASLDPFMEDLYGCTDALVWAREFVKMTYVKPEIAHDVETMLGWFANAIMAGDERGVERERSRPITDRIREVIFQAAGAGAVICLPNDQIFPSEEITEKVDQICEEFGIPPMKED
jgi:hypothetical protein